MNATDDRTLILYENATGDLSRVQALSKELDVPAFGLHIHDDDLWMYQFYVSGEQVDQFNPIPNYWENVSNDIRQIWAGNADLIAEHWTGINADDIRRYLIFQDSPGFNGEDKAYPRLE